LRILRILHFSILFLPIAACGLLSPNNALAGDKDMNDLRDRLNLTSQQMELMEPIVDGYNRDISEIFMQAQQGAKPSREEINLKWDEICLIRRKTANRLSRVLVDEQIEEYKIIMSEQLEGTESKEEEKEDSFGGFSLTDDGKMSRPASFDSSGNSRETDGFDSFNRRNKW